MVPGRCQSRSPVRRGAAAEPVGPVPALADGEHHVRGGAVVDREPARRLVEGTSRPVLQQQGALVQVRRRPGALDEHPRPGRLQPRRGLERHVAHQVPPVVRTQAWLSTPTTIRSS